jgi:hypothetical protein
MKKILFLFVLSCLFCGCMATKPWTYERFEAIPLGYEVEKIIAIYGPPYEITTLSVGEEYWYIQRIEIAPGLSDQVNYYFHIINGEVAFKRREQVRSGFSINIR